MRTLQDYFKESKERDIIVIAQCIEGHINENWKTVFEENRDQLIDAYEKAGDMAYGSYLNLLFLGINKLLKEDGLRTDTRLPGNLDISREWGNTDDSTDQERWMWSTITNMENGESIGTIVTKVYHDHTQLRLPRPPQVIALKESSKENVVQALSELSSDFKQALEFHVELAEYMKNNG
ncbi:DUF6022 family protein [Shimazuella kribbensis]|uniref:DUF6022 family protein n=1 Tax=Shimazuella kribbensis TaxID=139808 RepID=UPI0003FB1C93|nr:DUF6022 family protein [Shimazuella kribbensis]